MAGILGALLGYWFAGLPGAIAGFFVARMFGRGLLQNLSPQFANLQGGRDTAAEVFFNTVFMLLGKLAKADGRVSEAEIAHAEQLMTRLGIAGERRQQAINDFKQGSSDQFNLQKTLDQFSQLSRFRPDLKQNLLAFLVEMAMADGALDDAEIGVLKQVASGLGFDMEQFARTLEMLKAQHEFGSGHARTNTRDELEQAYKALGVDATVSDRELKRAYRRLMSQYHPDKMIAKGVPEDMLAMATEKAQEIQSAYDIVERARKSAA